MSVKGNTWVGFDRGVGGVRSINPVITTASNRRFPAGVRANSNLCTEYSVPLNTLFIPSLDSHGFNEPLPLLNICVTRCWVRVSNTGGLIRTPGQFFSTMPSLPHSDKLRTSFCKRYNSFQCIYHREHAIGFPAVQIVSNINHPKSTEVTRRWETRDKNALWWNVLCSQTAHPKGFLRSWFLRRVRSGFREELKMRNMDVNWKPIRTAPGVEAVALLTGYMRIQISTNLTEVKYSKIREDCGRTIDELLFRFRPQQAGNKSTKYASASRGRPTGRHLAPQTSFTANTRSM